MANYNFTFEDVIKYAEALGYEHRGEPSRAKDYTMTYWFSNWTNEVIMVLYEGKKRTLRGKDKPEVCWICIHGDGSVSSVPSRYFRTCMIERRGFSFTQTGKQRLANYYNKQEEDILCLD